MIRPNPVSLQDSDVRILTPHGDGVGKWGSGKDQVMISLESVPLGKAEGSFFIPPPLSEPQTCLSLATHLPASHVPVSASRTTTRKFDLQTTCFMVFSSCKLNVKTSTFFYLGRSCFFKQNVKLPFLKRGFQVYSHGLPSTSFIWHSPNMSVCYFGKPTLLNMLERPVSLIFSVLPNSCMFILMYSSTGSVQTSLTIRAP